MVFNVGVFDELELSKWYLRVRIIFLSLVVIIFIIIFIALINQSGGKRISRIEFVSIENYSISFDFTNLNGIYIDLNSPSNCSSRKCFLDVEEKNIKFLNTIKKRLKTQEEDFEEENFSEFYENYFGYFKYSTELDDFLGDYIQTFGEFEKNNFTGDCDDSGFYLASVSKSFGLRTKLVIGWNGKDGHLWNRIYINDSWKDFGSTNEIICDDCISDFYEFVYEVEV